jgi:septal ring factor EnvC (AmiA/AmiB activator)
MNPIYLAIPCLIAAVLTIACGVLYSTILRRDSQLESLKKALLTSHKHHANEREVSTKLEADLKQADEHFDALAKESKQIALRCDEWHNNYLDKGIELDNIINMPRRKREAVVKELKDNLAK